ncbi:beta-ketoacyl synthase [Xylaria telfairii]|nr:beta-ketoacyl synthase [Xylaria telfairii]
MANQLKLCIFGDQTCDLKLLWRELFQTRSNPAVEDFLTRAYRAVRQEVYRLPPEVRESVPRFTCVDDLLLSSGGSRRCVAIDTAVSCIYQLATFINKADNWYHGGGELMTVGLCLGGLAAAAVSCSRTTLDLIPRAVDSVIAAFRAGMHATETAKSLVPRALQADLEGNWSMVFNGSTACEALEKFCETNALPLTSRPYVSAFSANATTISGSPASLAQLVESEEFRGIKSKKISVFGPFHASHLYTETDVDEIVEGLGSGSGDSTTRPEQIPLLSSTGNMVESPDFATLLRAAVDAIMAQPMRFPELLEQLRLRIETSKPTSLAMLPIATTADRLVYKTFKDTPLGSLVPPPPSGAQANPKLPLHSSPSNPKTPKLAIIGMSGRFPGANSTDAFWDVLHSGLDMCKPVPKDRWDIDTHVDLTGARKNTGAVPYGCWIDDAGLFDARFFNISPREAPQIDPAQRLALMTVYEAIERSGIVVGATPSTRHDRVGVFYGVTGNDWAETNSAQDIDTYLIPGGNRAFIPGRINYFYKFSGPSYAIDTACSSAMSAFHIACNSLWRGDTDTAIAGGTNIMTNPDFHAGLDRGHFLSRTGNCKTFDDSADGYCRAEGVGTVIIKRLDDALTDNDPILAVILDTSTNHSSESESITRPHAGAQRAIFNKVMNQGFVDPYSISYVEMHGTGTQVGDATEMSSVLSGFAPPISRGVRPRSKEEALYLGSAKASIGHGEASSGSSSLIKVLLMMQKDTIVPHCGIKTKINHKFPLDLAERNVHIADRPIPWPRSSDPARPRRALVNNFSAAGGNCALLLEDAPLRVDSSDSDPDPRTVHLIAVSAKSGTSVQRNLRSLLGFLKENTHLSPGELSYTTTARRMHHQHRVMLVGSSIDGFCTQIETALRENAGFTRPKSAPKLVFTFTGQGAQFPGMGRELLRHVELFRKDMLRLDQLARSLGFPSMLPVIEAEEEQDINAFAPVAVQLASICMQIALAKLWASWNIVPTAVVGHSLGEYAALVVAGVLSEADALYLVGKRAELLQKQCTRDTHAMLVARGSVDEITDILGGVKATIEFACINSPVETVLAGTKEAISKVQAILADSGRKTTLLQVPFAFHSSQMDPMLSGLQEVARSVTFWKPEIPILCPLDGSVVKDAGVFGPEYLARHSRQPVNMLQALLNGRSSSIINDQTVMLEIGPHPATGGMVRAVLGSQVPTLASSQRNRSVWQVLGASLKHLYTAGADVRWAEYHAGFKASHRVLQLPSYCWDLKEYWIPYVHDWSLRKGEPAQIIQGGSGIESTTIHRVVEEAEITDGVRMVVEADIARSDLSPLVQGHEVDGIPLCTPSVYADIALNMGTYLLRRYRPGQEKNLVDVSDMVISKALILRNSAIKQLLQAHAEVKWSSDSATIRFVSFDSKQKLQEHARCVVIFKDTSLQQALQKEVGAVKEKLQGLRAGIVSGQTARYNRAMCYRAIRPLARFHSDYQAADEVLLDSSTLSCSSRLSFTTIKRGGSFHTHPAMIDALTQSCGFAMNCNDSADLDKDVYMNHGWGSLQLFEPINFEDEYTTYTSMKEGAEKLWHGDVVVLNHNDKVVAFFGQIAIQCVPRRVLKVILSIEAGAKSQNTLPSKGPQPTTTAHAASSERHAPQAPSPTPTASRAPPAPTNVKSQGGRPPAEERRDTNVAPALAIIAEESGLSVADLTDSTVFGDIGVDSLLGLTIDARFKEELGLDVDFNALIFEHPTVGDLKEALGGGGASIDNSDGTSSPASSDFEMVPSSSESAPSADNDGSSFRKEPLVRNFDFERAIQVISEESGVAAADLTDDTVFADAGVDSLLSLVIVSRFRDELGLDIQHESLFLECPTVAELKTTLLGEAVDKSGSDNQPLTANEQSGVSKNDASPLPRSQAEIDALMARENAVDRLVQKYTAGFTGPTAPPATALAPADDEKVVLVTGASGSLGSHLAYHIAQLPGVKTVVCLNRRNREEPYKRQIKAMRDKGIRFPKDLEPKLRVLQTDTSQPMLGLESGEYEQLVGSATHLIHSAWPMSAKRGLDGFESQFQVMKNLIQLACDVASRHPPSFKFTFQMVSSIGVVGLYGKHDSGSRSSEGWTKTLVPEARFGIDCILNNGYGDAKWGCECMLDETLHKHPGRFRAMVARLGQIAGSKTSGYWNPMEHFGFLLKSSQTLGALPDVPGDVYWTPVNDIADTLADLALRGGDRYRIYHVENPVGQPWSRMNAVLADAAGIPDLIPFEAWVERVRAAPQRGNPAATLLEFFDDNYIRMSCGGLVLNPAHTLEHSPSLRAVGPVSEEVVRKYVHIWKEIGFLN